MKLEIREREKMKQFLCLFIIALSAGNALAATVFFAAPAASGTGDGSSPENAARWNDQALWERTRVAVKKDAVTVRLAAGSYVVSKQPNAPATGNLDVTGLGDESHPMTISGAADFATVIRRNPADPDRHEEACRTALAVFRKCRNLTIENLFFTGPGEIGYAMQIRESSDILIRKCAFVDMPGVYYGATGAALGGRNIVWDQCRFDNIGYTSHAHHIYNAYKVRDITIRNCTFRDSYGDYVRFRDQCEPARVENCTFESTGRFTGYPFISIPLFNYKPGMERPEYFGTDLTVTNCRFSSPDRKIDVRQSALMFHHSGYNPPGRQHLIDRDEAEKLEKMSIPEEKKWFLDHTDIDFAKVHLRGNTYTGIPAVAYYECLPKYGAEKESPREKYENRIVVTRLLPDDQPAITPAATPVKPQ